MGNLMAQVLNPIPIFTNTKTWSSFLHYACVNKGNNRVPQDKQETTYKVKRTRHFSNTTNHSTSNESRKILKRIFILIYQKGEKKYNTIYHEAIYVFRFRKFSKGNYGGIVIVVQFQCYQWQMVEYGGQTKICHINMALRPMWKHGRYNRRCSLWWLA